MTEETSMSVRGMMICIEGMRILLRSEYTPIYPCLMIHPYAALSPCYAGCESLRSSTIAVTNTRSDTERVDLLI